MTIDSNIAIQSCAMPGGSGRFVLLPIISKSNHRWIDNAIANDCGVLNHFPGGRDLLDCWRQAEPDWNVDWHCSFGSFSPKAQDQVNPFAAWLSLFLHLSSHYPEVEWRSSTAIDGVFRSSHTLLSRPSEIRVIDQRLLIRTNGLWRDVDALPQNSWFEWDNEVIDLFMLEGWRSIVDGGEPCLDQDGYYVDQTSASRLCSAIQLLELLPFFADWVRQVLRVTVFLSADPGITMSSSDDRNPSTVRLTVDGDPANGAELLVHECAHIYFSILERETCLTQGKDDRLYYSPFRKAKRPLRSILLAYHAFANVAMMYQCFSQIGYRPLVMESRCEALWKLLRPLEQILVETDDLTNDGLAFSQIFQTHTADHL
jgi:hypothetical protein